MSLRINILPALTTVEKKFSFPTSDSSSRFVHVLRLHHFLGNTSSISSVFVLGIDMVKGLVFNEIPRYITSGAGLTNFSRAMGMFRCSNNLSNVSKFCSARFRQGGENRR